MAPFRRPFDPVQQVVAQAIQSMPIGSDQGTAPLGALMNTQRRGVAPATVPGSYDLFAGQGSGGFGQGSYGTEGSQPNRQTTSVF